MVTDLGADGGAIGGGRMSGDSDRMGGLLLIVFGGLLFVAAGVVAWSMMLQHGEPARGGISQRADLRAGGGARPGRVGPPPTLRPGGRTAWCGAAWSAAILRTSTG